MLRVAQKITRLLRSYACLNLYYNSSLIDIVYCLQLLENIQASVSRIEEGMIKSSDVLNLERRLKVQEGQATENQFDLVRKSLKKMTMFLIWTHQNCIHSFLLLPDSIKRQTANLY